MENPFLSQGLEKPWAALTADNVQPAMAEALERARTALDQIKALADVSDYETTFFAFYEALNAVQDPWNLVAHLQSVDDSPARREAFAAALPQVTAFFTETFLDSALCAKLQAAADQGTAWTEAQKRYASERLADFREAGADLPAEKKARVGEIARELAKLCQKFDENVLDSTNAYTLDIDDPTRLAGLPEHALASALETAQKAELGSKEKPVWRFTLQAPSMLPVMQSADDDGLRETIWRAAQAIGSRDETDNEPLISQILALRDAQAKLLGHQRFADHVLGRRMAKTGQAALDFCVEIGAKSRSRLANEDSELRAFRAAQTGEAERLLHPWERMYWSEKMRQAKYAFDIEALRPYFSLTQVQDGMFRLAEDLFAIKIAPVEAPGWHPEVETFEITDAETGRLCGRFHTDWYPRETKRAGAWMNCLVYGTDTKPNLGLMCGNLTPASGGKPALLSHADVLTLFHEFGHLLHGLLSAAPIHGLHSLSVAWDFIELPSQIMENWCWERASLDRFAAHWETGEKIPDELLNGLRNTRNYMVASAQMRQMGLAVFDLELHVNYAQWRDVPLDDAAKRILPDYQAESSEWAGHAMRRFNHIFGDPVGYAAGYYSYKWAEVLEADAFSRFEREGLLNPETGRAYRDTVLAAGNLKPADQLFRDFMGRDPDPDALLRRQGLLS